MKLKNMFLSAIAVLGIVTPAFAKSKVAKIAPSRLFVGLAILMAKAGSAMQHSCSICCIAALFDFNIAISVYC